MSPSVYTLALVLIVCGTLLQADAFTALTKAPLRTGNHGALQAGRRDFLDAAMATTAGLVVASIPTMAGAEEEIADDLAMPSEEEQKKAVSFGA